MIRRIVRRLAQLVRDPILRRWIAGRIIGIYPGEPAFEPHSPPYLKGLRPLGGEVSSQASFKVLPPDPPTSSITISLAGASLVLEPGDEKGLFHRDFEEFESYLALHRFAWLPLLGDQTNPAWVNLLWLEWSRDFGASDSGWPWHPYTATERAVNILRFAERRGLPGPAEETLATLVSHGISISKKLEYFGDHHTSNHLANNGRGLYLIGLALKIAEFENLGRRILEEEAERIFLPSGILREGSSHYHLLLTRNYIEAWLASSQPGKTEVPAFRETAARALAAAAKLSMPGRFPLIGDISPDCPPTYLTCLISDERRDDGFLDGLGEVELSEFNSLINGEVPIDRGSFATDGWVREDFGLWAALWHASPDGWSHMPGHGHQDCGGFEIHYGDDPLFIDLGRGAYEESGEAAFYKSAGAHNSLTIDGNDPYPPNKPYYAPEFRRRAGGAPPEFTFPAGGLALTYSAGANKVTRNWRFSDNGFQISDQVDGTGQLRIRRLLHTIGEIDELDNHLIIRCEQNKFKLSWTGADQLHINECVEWSAYGTGKPAQSIVICCHARAPWRGVISIEAIS
jgi:hypothetical protein